MGSVGTSAVRIIDSDNDVVTVTDGRLDVNAELVVGDVNVGNIDIVSFPSAAVGDGTRTAALRVTIASDSSSLSIDDGGGSLTIDGTVALSIADNAVLDVIASSNHAEDAAHSSGDKGTFVLGIQNEDEDVFSGTNADYVGIGVDRSGFVGISNKMGLGLELGQALRQEDSAHVSGETAMSILAVRRDAPETGSADGDYSTLNISAQGGLYVEEIVHGILETFDMIDVDNASEALSGTIGTVTDIAEIMLQADEANTGYVIVGDVDVADNRGMKLNPGDTIILDIDDSRVPFLWGSAENQNVRCMLKRRTT